MNKTNCPVTPAVRLLRDKMIAFEPHLYDYKERGGTALSAAELGVPEHIVIKTLVMETDSRDPLLVLMHGDREVSTKELARAIGVRSVTVCDPAKAQKHTGYLVGGTSPLGARKELPVYAEKTIFELPRIYINGGQRGFLVSIRPADLRRALTITEVVVAIVQTEGKPGKRTRDMSDHTREPAALNESDVDPDPFVQFARWFAEAEAAVPILPNAMTLASATPDGAPSARVVLLKSFDEQGFVFYTNYESHKGRELDENPAAALVFYWAELSRQVRISGRVTRTSREESEAYFHTRPLDSQLGALASRQSEVITNRDVLEAKMEKLLKQHENGAPPLPAFWGGYRLAPATIEFWQGRPSRLHDRLRYTKLSDGKWLIQRLSP